VKSDYDESPVSSGTDESSPFSVAFNVNSTRLFINLTHDKDHNRRAIFPKAHDLADQDASISHALTGQQLISIIFPKILAFMSFID
jgi:hypothetical protein